MSAASFLLQFPPDLGHTEIMAGLLALSGLSQPGRDRVHRLVVQGTTHGLAHHLATTEAAGASVAAQLRATIPGLVLTEAPLPPSGRYVWRLWSSSARRPLADRPADVGRGLLVAMQPGLARSESISLHWLLGPVRRPRPVGSRPQAMLSESWPRALATAAVTPPGELDADARRALRNKLELPGWRLVGYISVSADSRSRAQQLAAPVLAALRTAEGPGSHLGVRRALTGAPERTPWRWNLLCNVRELTGLLGWPIDGAGSGLLVAQRASRVLPPPRGLVSSGRLLAHSPTTGQELHLSRLDSRQHLHVLGPTGTGKSTLLVHLMLQDIRAGHSVVALDPKGQLVADVLARFPGERQEDLVIIEPGDRAPVGLNPLHGGDPELVADQLLSIFAELYASSWGPRTGDVLHAALLTLARSPATSLAHLPLLLTHDGYRRQLVGRLDDPLGLGAFWSWYEARTEPERSQIIGPTLNKVRPFLVRPALRAILGQAQPRFGLREVFTHRRVLLVNLAKGQLGPEGSTLLGTLLLNQLWQTTLERSALDPERLHTVYLYIDEVQDFLRLPGDVGDILAQARSLGLAMTLAHQHLGQLSPGLQASILSNARSRVCFQLASADAAILTRGQTLLSATDLSALPAYEVYLRLVARNQQTPFFSGRTLPPEPASRDGLALRHASRERYGVAARDTEAALRALVAGGVESQPDAGTVGLRPRRRP